MSPDRAGEKMDEIGWPTLGEIIEWDNKISYGDTKYTTTRPLIEARVYDYSISCGITGGNLSFLSHIAKDHLAASDYYISPRWVLDLARKDGNSAYDPDAFSA